MWRSEKRAEKGFDPEKFFLALSDKTRLRLLNLMGDYEVCVCLFVEILQVSQPKISRHLAYLRRVGLVDARREGKWAHYRITSPTDIYAGQIFRHVRNWLDQDPGMRRERSLLVEVCCRPELPDGLQDAPRPLGLEYAPSACIGAANGNHRGCS